MDAIKPGEKRLLSYAADVGLLVDAKQKADNQRTTKIFIEHGAMIQSTEERQEETYTIRNRDTASRVLIVEHPARTGWRLTDGETPTKVRRPITASALPFLRRRPPCLSSRSIVRSRIVGC